MKRFAVLVVGAVCLGGCSTTLPVAGQLQNSPETLAGSATGYTDGTGNLVVKTSSGATCSGRFVYKSMRDGEGVLKCSDGRSGPFHFVLTDYSGTGTGDLNGQPFTFTLGSTA